jgi:enoyl-CoA hydratase/carnithine racemase
MTADFTDLRYETRGAAAWITLDRPREMNAMGFRLLDELASAFALALADDAVRALVVTASGEKVFCAGADLKQVLEPRPAGEPDFLDVAARTFDRLRKFPKPTIAAVNGLALAGGLELVLACDLVVAAETARFGDAHANFGVFPGAGGAAVLPKRIGATRAKYLLFTGEQLSAAEMMAAGLVNQVVPAAELAAAAEALAAKLAAKSPLVLRRMKEVADAALDQPRDAALAHERLALRDHLRSCDLQEGIAAFREKRAPRFAGR